MKTLTSCLSYVLLILISGLASFNYVVFVFPNNFAPSGVDGICTMIQYITNTNMGYLSLVFNVPLLVVGFFITDKNFIIKTAIYTLSFSLFVVLLSFVDVSKFIYLTESGTSIVLAPVTAGVIRGLLYYVTLRSGSSGGGVDIVAKIITKYKPHYNFLSIIFFINTGIAICAYFVYDFQVEPVVCSIIYSFIASVLPKHIETTKKQCVRFEIITNDAEKLCREISKNIGVSSTVLDVQGGYSKKSGKMVLCVTDKKSAPKVERMLKEYQCAISFESTITTMEKTHKY